MPPTMTGVYPARGPAMPVKATPSAPSPKTTWLDLISPDDPDADLQRWQTREALLDELAATRRPVSERTLKYWEARGALPRPIVRWRDGRPHTWYPPFARRVIKHLLDRQDDGIDLDAIRPFVDHFTTEILKSPPPDQTPRGRWNEATDAVVARLADVASLYDDLTGHRIVQAEIRMTDDRGRTITLRAWPGLGLPWEDENT